MSHHLALHTGANIVPCWVVTDQPHSQPKPNRHVGMRNYNILVVPHPESIDPLQFRPLTAHAGVAERFPTNHGLFEFVHREHGDDFAPRIGQLISHARQAVGPIDGVVLPEAALDQQFFGTQFGWAPPGMKMPAEDIQFFICGLSGKASEDSLGSNFVNIRCLCSSAQEKFLADYRQDKHHRWALDGPQIRNYGLTRTLHPDVVWWEAIGLPTRELHFFLLDNHFVFSVLICEDLARPDPIGDLIRSVGPNLVIALLMDGPQLSERWASRYATALADDPGSSVLTVTSLGMSRLSRPKGHKVESERIVALWKDPWTGTRPLSLPDGAEALVLSLTESRNEELTADGRSDNCHAGCVKLGEILAIDRSGKRYACPVH